MADTTIENVHAFDVDAAESLQDAVAAIGAAFGVHVTYLMAHTPEGSHDDFFLRSTYSLEWIGRYILKRYVHVDPIVREGFLRRLPFDWREVELTEDAAEMMSDAVSFGLHAMGYCWPLTDRFGRRGLLSVNGPQDEAGWNAFLDRNRDELAGLAQAIHARALRQVYGEKAEPPNLTGRELECLYWTAQGKSASVIADILGISQHTVKVYLKNIRTKMGVASLRSAVVEAQKLRLLSPRD